VRGWAADERVVAGGVELLSAEEFFKDAE